MPAKISVQRLRAAAPVEQARLLRSALSDSEGDIQGITTVLLTSIAEGRLPPLIIRTWLGITRSPQALASAFYQNHSVYTRNIAIKYMVKMLRKDQTFESTWKALGGTQRLGQHMATLSINQHRDLCAALGSLRGAGDEQHQELRQQRITELYDYLVDPGKNTHEYRPVKPAYARLLPSCAPGRAETYMKKKLDDIEWISPRLLREMEDLAETDWDGFGQRAFENEFATGTTRVELKRLKIYINHSQSFGMRVLEAIASRKDLQIPNRDHFMTDLALPLARCCASKRRRPHDVAVHHHLWKLLNTCFAQDANLRIALECLAETQAWGSRRREPTLLECAAKSWNYCRGDDKSNQNLAKLISLFPAHILTHEKLKKLLKSLAPGLRYRFLRIWLASSPSHQREIGDVHGHGSSSLKGLELPVTLLALLSAADSLAFFERGLEQVPDRSFLSADHSSTAPALLMQTQEQGSNRRPDFHIVRAFLIKRTDPKKIVLPENPDSVIEGLRSSELERRKKLAREGKGPEVRAFWTLSCLRLCASLRDFDLLNNTIVWARRFNKDPLAVKAIYPYFNIIPFLSYGAMTHNERVYATKEGLKQMLIEGNATIKNLLETVMLIHAERSFDNENIWDNHTVNLAARVAIVRLRKVRDFQVWLQMSDDEVFEVLLQPTMDLLLNTETTLIDYDGAYIRNMQGLLRYGSDQLGYEETPPTAAELRFWEALAIERDALWERKRCSKYPEVMTLPSPWPKGLPVQELIPSMFGKNITVPYVTKRAENVVFCDPNIALQPAPEDKEIRKVIDNFIDSYPDALTIWVGAADDEKEQQKRIKKAWDYALGPLTGDRMTPREAEMFWHHRAFRSAENLLNVTVDFSNVRYPEPVTPSADADGPFEWDPDPTYHHISESKPHTLGTLTLLDCMLWSRHTYLADMVELWSESVSKSSFWDFCWQKNDWDLMNPVIPRKISSEKATSLTDSLIAAAVLTIEGVHGQGASVLKSPFPSPEDPRYPAVYLDQDFLERESENIWRVIGVLKSLRAHVPPELLAQLAGSVLTKLSDASEIARWGYRKFVAVVKIIIESDNPSLSTPLIQKFVLESHGASSYFRDMLGPTLMNKLSAEDARQLFESLAANIISRLSEAQAKKKGASEESSETDGQSAPSVKITTVKLLATIPREGRAIGTQQTLATLKNILCQSSHIDIRRVALQSLVETADDDESVKTDVHKFLEEWAPKLAGSMSEMRPETDEDWAVAERGGSLPEVNADRPILGIVLDKFDPECEIVRRSLEASTENNNRWLRLFVQKHGPAAFTGSSSELPPFPASPMGVLALLERQTKEVINEYREPILTVEHLQTLKNYVLFLMDPPDWVMALTKYVENSQDLLLSNAGRHWMDMWQTEDLEKPYAKYLSVGGEWACETLNIYKSQHADDSPDDSNKVKVYQASAALEDFVFDLAQICIRRGNVEALYGLLDKLELRWDVAKDTVYEERGSGKVLQRIVEYVERLRTPEWKTNPQRQPPRLPDLILLRTRLLYLPRKGSDGVNSVDRKHVSHFVKETIGLVHTIADNNVPYETRFSALGREVRQCCEDRLYVATLLGDVNTFRDSVEAELADLLRVRLAVSVMKEVQRIGDWEGEDGMACRRMVKTWEGSLCEDLREQAAEVRNWTRTRFPEKEDAAGTWFA